MLKALWTGEYNEEWNKTFCENFVVEKASHCIGAIIPDGLLKADEVTPLLKDKDILIAGYDPLTEKTLLECPDLKLILSVRDGPEDNIDIATCTKMGIPVISAGGRCMHSVAEMNMTIMFNLACHFYELSTRMRNEGWRKDGNLAELLFSQTELFEKTLSIIGLGKNGKELAKLANGIGMKVVAYDPYVSKEQADALNVTKMSLEEAMKAGDYVTLLARVTPETTHMIKKEHIEMMKPTAYLINTGRPKLCDENIIFDALEANVIKGAALDVFNEEPLPLTARAYSIPSDKLLMTPHMAGISVERVPHQYENIFDGYKKFLKGDLTGVSLYNREVLNSPEFPNRGGKLFGIEK